VPQALKKKGGEGCLSHRKNILIIEDDEDLALTLSTILEGEGYRLFTAFNGEDGLRIANAIGPDLIILDLKMPKMHGAGVFAALRGPDGKPRIPTLIMTGYADAAEIYPGFSVEGIYQKPMDLPVFMGHVRRILSPSRDAN